MPLKLLPLEEADLPANDNIMHAAFGPDLMSCMYPNGYSDADRVVSLQNARSNWAKHHDDYRYLKVIDTDLPDDDPNGRIIGTAKWQVYSRQRSEEEMDKEEAEAGKQEPGPTANREMLAAFFGELMRTRRQNLAGQPHVLLSILATNPQHHRRGVGAMHMDWGMKLADELGLPAYLEASPKGKPLYERYGFKEMGKMDFDARDWGKEYDIPHYFMLRPAKA